MKKLTLILSLIFLLSGCSDDYSKIESCASSETLRAYPDEGIKLTMNKSLRKKLFKGMSEEEKSILFLLLNKIL